METPTILDKIKQENFEVETEQEEVCLEITTVEENDLSDFIKEESLSSNKSNEEYDGKGDISSISNETNDKNKQKGDVDGVKVTEFAYVTAEDEVGDVW